MAFETVVTPQALRDHEMEHQLSSFEVEEMVKQGQNVVASASTLNGLELRLIAEQAAVSGATVLVTDSSKLMDVDKQLIEEAGKGKVTFA